MKLVVSDLDGTLLNKKSSVSKENAEALRYVLNQEGVDLTIASGRNYNDVRTLCDKIGINPYIISSNGTCIYDNKGNKIKETAIKIDEAREIVKNYISHGYFMQIALESEILMPKGWEEIVAQQINELLSKGIEVNMEDYDHFIKAVRSQAGVREVDDLVEYITDDMKIFSLYIGSFDLSKLDADRKFMNNFEDLITLSAMKGSFEVIRKGSTKGDSLEILCEMLNIDISEVMAMGDNFNDETMLTKAGLGIAMGNAEDHIKSVSNYVTLDNNSNGVAHAIYKFISKSEKEDEPA